MKAHETLLAEARRTPLTRGAIADLAGRVDLGSVAEIAPGALEREGAHVATVLAAILVTSGKKLDPKLACALLPELGTIELFGPMAFAADGDIVDVLLGFLDEARGNWECETLAVLLAVDATLADKRDVSPRLLIHARRLSRNEIGPEATILLGGAAHRLGDKHLSELAAPLIAKAKRGKRAIDDAIAAAKRSLAEALEETAQRMTGGDYTVRRDGPEVGRNDPCPCGSGAKYKKCCALKPKSTAFEVPRIDEATLHPEQASMLRATEIAQLDPKRIPSRALVHVYRRALRFRRWALAEKLLEEVLGRKDIKAPEEFRLEMLDEALMARDRAVVETTVAKLPPKLVPEALHLEIACLGGAADVLGRIEKAALVALTSEHQGLDAIELALVLLRNYPALGILAARGTLHEGRVNDSTAVLEAMEDARDRLLLAPLEPYWDFYDAMVDGASVRKKVRAEGDKAAALEQEVRRARAESRGASAEANKLKKRLEELDAALARAATAAPSSTEVPASKPTLDESKLETLEEERRRLRGKVDELQRIIGQGHDERRELRKKLTEVEEAALAAAPMSERDEEEEEETEDDDESTEERPRNILVPLFSDKGAKSLAELDGPAAEIVLGVIASLAAGRENAWGSVKKLTKLKSPFFSARAGIHHRVLFAIDDRALKVHEVIHRRDLEQAVNRLGRV